MEKFESEIEKLVFNRFKECLIGNNLTIRKEDKWQTSLSIKYFDIVIYKGINPHVIIEVKGHIYNKNILARATDQVRSALTITNARFGIVTDNERFFLYDRSKKELDFIELEFKTIINEVLNTEKIKVDKKDREEVLKIILSAAENHLSFNQEFQSFIKSKSLFGHIQFDTNSNTYFFLDDDEGISTFENQFFIKMLGEYNETKICRYTSLKTIFEMLNNISFRMNGIVGMNDKSEVNYVETYLNGIEKPLIKEHHNTIIAINNKYITSCSMVERKDDLTLWRLYSDDAKGACLIFDVKRKNLNNHILLQKVKYADEDGKHKELDFLKQIKEDVETITGYKFEFRKIGYWKHFFKPYDYSIEEEVRLLIIDNDSLVKIKSDWVMTSSHSIINPIMDFRLNSKSFPIQLKEIILGPKCVEQETNLVQIQEIIRRKKKEIAMKSFDASLNSLKVVLSKIKHYR
jgi:hypothetical protein